jgi:hypothetical protein
MKKFNVFLALFLMMDTAFLLSKERLLSVLGVSPNALLIFALLLMFAGIDLKMFVAVLAATLIAISIILPFWSIKFFILFLLATGIYFLKKNMTGNKFVDFLASTLLVTVVFYGLMNFKSLSVLLTAPILWEVAYNLLLGAVGWFVLMPLVRFLKNI